VQAHIGEILLTGNNNIMYEYNIHIIPYTNEIYRGHLDTRTPFAERTELVCASK
jgi:hypothetical protein